MKPTLLSFVLFHAALSIAQTGTPFPSGFSVVAPAPNADTSSDTYGRNPRLALDGNGDPMVSFLWANTAAGGADQTALYFTAWSRAQGKFTAPVRVALTGDVSNSGRESDVPQSLSRDTSNGTLGIAYRTTTRNGADALHIALSTDAGATWRDQTILSVTNSGLYAPSLVLVSGKVYLSFYQDTVGVLYYTGNQADAPARWTSQTAPDVSGYSQNNLRISSVAVDSTGAPAVAYLLGSDTSYNVRLIFWRPGSSPVVVGDTNNIADQGDDIKLAFYGAQPRIAFQGDRDDTDYYDNYQSLFAIQSSDGGRTWGQFAKVPSDRHTTIDTPIWLAVGSKGQAAIVATNNGGSGDNVCGQPKISRSTDFVNWTTCAPAPAGQPDFYALGGMAAFGPDDRLTVVFQTITGQGLSYGVNIWREPGAVSSGPQISPGGVVNAASYQATVAPGSLAAIFGSNLTASSDNASTVPFPQSLAGVRVTVNGLAAPLYFAGPTQIDFQVPYETPVGNASVVVTSAQGSSAPAAMTVATVAPGIFVFNGNRAVAQNADYSINDSGNGARPGSGLVVYMTGSGPVTNPVGTGFAAPDSPLSYMTTTPITAKIGSTAAQVVFAGLAPEFVGVMQVNVVIPTMTPGDYPLTITVGSATTNSALVTVGR